jgi:hypothetical protein
MSNKYKNVELVKPSGLELKIVWWVLIVLPKGGRAFGSATL